MILFFLGKVSLSDLVKLLSVIEGRDDLLDKSYILRIIGRELVSRDEVVKVGRGRGAKYCLTDKGRRSIGAIRIDGDVLRSMLVSLVKEFGGVFSCRDVILLNSLTHFQCKLVFEGREVYVRFEDGAVFPRDLDNIDSFRVRDQLSDEFLHYLGKLKDEKILFGVLREDAERHRDKFFMVVINGSDPRRLPRVIRGLIDDVADKLGVIVLKGAVDRIEYLISKLPENVFLIFTEGDVAKTRRELKSKLMDLLSK